MTTIHKTSLAFLIVSLLGFASTWAEDQPSAPEPATAAPQATDSAATVTGSSASVDTSDLLRTDHPDQYKVVKSDTLWGIASRFLKNPWMWPEIWHVNPQIANPHLIFPGDTINLIYLEGQPRLTVKRGEEGVTYKMSPETTTADTTTQVAGSADVSQVSQSQISVAANGDQRLKPSIRVMPLAEPIPAIPLKVIAPFLSGTRVVTSKLLDEAPYVMHGSQGHVVTGAGGEFYARGKFDPKSSTYGIFRQGKVYRDPDTNELLGIQAVDIGTGKIKSQDKDIARLSVVRSTQETRIGDKLLLNQERRVDSTFFPSSPETNIDGQIIDVEGGVTQVAVMSVVAINKGERDDLQSGNVLAIFQRGEVVRDPLTDEQVKLLDERAGLIMVFAIFEKMSYALVLYADRPLHVGDHVRKP